MRSSETLCFTCGQPAGDPPRRNLLASGQACPACALRALEAVPPALPSEGFGGVARREEARWSAPSPSYGVGAGDDDDRPLGA